MSIWASLVAQKLKNLPAMQETLVHFLGWEDPLEKDRLPTPGFLAFPSTDPPEKQQGSKGNDVNISFLIFNNGFTLIQTISKS